MEIKERDWRRLMRDLADGKVVPVIGPELLPVAVDGETVNLFRHVTKELVERFDIEESEMREGYGLNHVAEACLRRPRSDRDDSYFEIREILEEREWETPEPIRQLAAIAHFDLFISTTVDSLVEQALNEARFGGEARTRSLAYCMKSELSDLPLDYRRGYEPTVFQFFGKLNPANDFAILDEDILAFARRLQSSYRRPNNLFDLLRNRHMLMLGCNFPGWLTRFFMAAAKGEELFAEGSRGVLADNVSSRDEDLVTFLDRYKTTVFPGGAVAFVEELHRRWMEEFGDQDFDFSAEAAAAEAALEPSRAPAATERVLPELRPESAFISFHSGDRESARAIAKAFETAGVDTWFDEGELDAGDDYRAKIEANIENCSYFFPLISRHSVSSKRRFFHIEWHKAIDEAKFRPQDYPFIQPIIVDDTPMESEGIPREFRQCHCLRLADLGKLVTLTRDRIRRAGGVAKEARKTSNPHPPVPEIDADAASENPWMGLAAYGENDARLFCGRRREVEALDRQVHREALTVVFGPSGTGKSSLLNAGLFPRWRAERLLPVGIRMDYSGNAPPDSQVREGVAAAIAEAGVEAVPLNEPFGEGHESAWEYLHRHAFWDRRNQPVTPVLVFDQFEEVFTLGRGGPETDAFLEQLADLAENYLPAAIRRRLEQADVTLPRNYSQQRYKIVLSLREDFVSRLDGLSKAIPSVMLNRFSLKRMNGRQALEVVLEPGRGIVGEPVAREIVEFVATGNGADPEAVEEPEMDREEEDPDSEFELLSVEPALLSLVCRELNNRRLTRGQPEITSEQLEASSDDILETFYERSFEGTENSSRIFIEDRLVTASGFRSAVPMEDALESGLGEAEVAALIDRRLIRKEERLGIPHLELTHDVLTGVVRRSRDTRRERERLEAERLERAERARRTRKRVLTLGSAALVFFGLMLFSSVQWWVTEKARKEAETARKAALSQNLLQKYDKLKQDEEFDLAVLLLAAAHHENALNLESNEVEKAYRIALTSHLVDTLAHRDSVTAVAWAPGKEKLAFISESETGGEGGRIEIWSWNPRTGGALIGEKSFAGGTALAWSGDGTRLAIGNQNGEIVIRNPETGTVGKPIEVSDQKVEVKSMAWKPSGDELRLAWASRSGEIGILDPASGENLPLASRDGKPVNAVAWKPDGVRLASADDLGRIRIWNSEDRTIVETIENAHSDEVWCLSWRGKSQGESLLASGGREGEIRIWDLNQPREGENREPLETLSGHERGVRGVEWTGDRLASAGRDGPIRIWEPAPGSEPDHVDAWNKEATAEFDGHEADARGSVRNLSWNGTHLASSGVDGTIRIWDPESAVGPDLVQDFGGVLAEEFALNAVAWNPDGDRLAIGATDGKVWVRLWNAPGDPGEDPPFAVEASAIRALAWAPAGDRLAIACNDGAILIRESPGGRLIKELAGTEDGSPVRAVVWDRGGTRLASAGDDGRIRIWETGDWRPAIRQPFPSDPGAAIRALAWHSGGDVAWGDDDYKFWIWKFGGDDPPLELGPPHEELSYSIAWAGPGDKRLAMSKGKAISVWDVDGSEKPIDLAPDAHGEYTEVNTIAWSPGGRRLASGGSDDNVIIWEPSPDQSLPVHVLTGHRGGVSSVAWDPERQRLASVSSDQSLRIWNFDEESLLKRARRLVNRNLTKAEWKTYIGELYRYRKLFEDLPIPETTIP